MCVCVCGGWRWQHLVSTGVTTSARLGIRGGSNGGLLMGNMLVQRPDLFGAVVCAVPLLDMKRFSHLLAGASWCANSNPSLSLNPNPNPNPIPKPNPNPGQSIVSSVVWRRDVFRVYVQFTYQWEEGRDGDAGARRVCVCVCCF